MNSNIDLLKQKDFRQFAGKPFSSLGYLNVVESILHACLSSRGKVGNVPRLLIRELFHNLGERRAVITEAGDLTFSQLEHRAVTLANGLYRKGVMKGDRVAVLLDNEQAWFETMLACMLMGIKMPMLNTHLNKQELKQCINSCQPKVLVFSERFVDVIKEIESELTSIECMVCTGESDFPSLESIIQSGDYHLPPGGFGMAQMPFSGGSSGVPKFIQDDSGQVDIEARMKGVTKRDYQNLRRRFIYGLSKLGMGSIDKNIVSLIPGPLYHSGPQAAVAPLYIGGTVVSMKRFDAESFLHFIEKEKVNFTFVAPTMLERVLKLPEAIKGKYNLSSMQVILCASAPCPDYVKLQINELFLKQGASCNVFNEYYGSSEALLISVLRAKDYEENPERYKSVGKAIVSDTRIYNYEEKRWCNEGEVGHVLVRNPRIYRVKAGNTNDINSSLHEIDGVYWYDDGCLGYLDKDKFLYLTSRSKDMIISGGVNIFPTEIEEAIKSYKDILDVAVVKVSDQDLGEVPGALVQMLNGRQLDEEKLIAHCKDKGLYGFKLPKYIRLIDKLPKNEAGKIRKSDLEKNFYDLA